MSLENPDYNLNVDEGSAQAGSTPNLASATSETEIHIGATAPVKTLCDAVRAEVAKAVVSGRKKSSRNF